MTMSSLTTEVRPTSQQSTRGGRRIDRIVLHHCASTDMDGVLSMMQSGSREVSANYVVKDNRIASVVPEENRSWSLSSADWDGRSITFEIANESAGGAWPVSAASHQSVAKVIADISKRYGIPINRDTVLGHREVYSRYGASYPTACPGGLDMDRIVATANQILSGNTDNERNDKMPTYTPLVDGNLKPAGASLIGETGKTVTYPQGNSIVGILDRVSKGLPILAPQRDTLAAEYKKVAPDQGAAPVIDYAQLAKLIPAAPTADEVAAKVIEYQKKPGN